MLATVCCRFGSWGLVIKLNFCSGFEHFGQDSVEVEVQAKLAFLVILGQALPAHLVPCWWVGWWLWRAGCISQDTYLLYDTFRITACSVLIKDWKTREKNHFLTHFLSANLISKVSRRFLIRDDINNICTICWHYWFCGFCSNRILPYFPMLVS